jgi:hypothetical protein
VVGSLYPSKHGAGAYSMAKPNNLKNYKPISSTVSPEVDEYIRYLADINFTTRMKIIREILTDYVKAQGKRENRQMKKIDGGIRK